MSTARLVLLDAESADALDSLGEEQLHAHLPPGTQPLEPLRLSAFGAPPVVRRPVPQPIDWNGLAGALLRLVQAAREEGRGGARPVHTLVGGQAPLPLFVLAGLELSPWIGDLTLINRRKQGPWDALVFDASLAPAADGPFDVVRGLPDAPMPGPGLVAVSLTTRGVLPERELLADFCRSRGHDLTGVVELGSRGKLTLEASNARAAFAQIEGVFDALHGLFPHRRGIALFVDGPATLAFLVGRAINPNVFSNVHVANYDGSRRAYDHAFTLPWTPEGAGTRAQAQVPPARAAIPAPASPSGERRPETILFFAANPASTDRLLIDEEIRDIEAKIRAAEYRDVFELRPRLAARAGDLLQALNERRPAIVHFSGHGQADGIMLQRDDGTPHRVGGQALAELFHSVEGVRIVVLNACFSDEQASAITEAVECAIGMNAAVDDEAARVFSGSFYRALGFGLSVQQAFAQGQAALRLEGLSEEAAPRLLTRAGVDAATIFLFARE